MQHIHFIGIGGVGMSGLAQILRARSVRVSGSDPNTNAATERLEAQGAVIYRTQTAENISADAPNRPDFVVMTAAIKEDNPELQAARTAGIPVVSRAEFLGRLMAEYRGPRLAVTGTHGKTTTTAMLSEVLAGSGFDATVLIGAEYAGIGGNVRVSTGDAFLTEACEAYDSFLALHPDIAVITNVEADHLDYYGTEANVFASFHRFVTQTTACLVYCAEDAGVRRLLSELPEGTPPQRIGYGFEPSGKASFWAEDAILSPETDSPVTFRLRSRFEREERDWGQVRLCVPGRHNLLNALAALAAGYAAHRAAEEGGVTLPPYDPSALLAAFHGTERRLEHLGEKAGVLVMDDYAHHPTEIRATFAALREAYPTRRLVVVFQPHLYSRTRDFMEAFAQELSQADAILLTDIYAARETPIPGVGVSELTHKISLLAPDKTLLYLPEKSDLVGALDWVTQRDDLVLTMGAGDIRVVGEAFLAGSREKVFTNGANPL